MHEALVDRAAEALSTAMTPTSRHELHTRMRDLDPSDRARLAYALRDVTYAVTGVQPPAVVIDANLLIVDSEA